MRSLKFLNSTLEFVKPSKTSEVQVASCSSTSEVPSQIFKSKIPVKKVLACSSKDPEEKASSSSATSARAPANLNEVICVDSLLGEGDETEMKNADYLIKEDAGKVLFLNKLILTRRLFRNKQNFSAGNARLMAEVRQAGVDVNMQDVIKRRSYWLDVYNAVKRGKQQSLFMLPLTVIFGDASIDTLIGTEFQVGEDCTLESQLVDPMKVATTAAMFTKGGSIF